LARSNISWTTTQLSATIAMSLNVTAAAYHPSAQDVYANVDFSSLSWIERQWAGWYISIGNLVIATGLMSFLLHEVGLHLTPPVRLSLPSNARSFISVVPSLGLLLTLYRISASGNFNPARSPLPRNNGSAPSWFYFRISPLNCQWYILPRPVSPH